MAESVVPVVDKGWKVLSSGLSFSRALTLQEWETCGRQLAEIHNRTTWAIGDWLVYGEGRGDYGEYYTRAAEITRRSPESLSQGARVSKAFPLEKRAIAVPWSYYREALRLDGVERVQALSLAAQNRWTRDDLADYITSRGKDVPVRDQRTRGEDEHDREQRATAATARQSVWQRAKTHRKIIQCPSCGFHFEPKRRHVSYEKVSA